MYRKLFRITVLSSIIASAISCSSNHAKISGKFAGQNNNTLYFESLTPAKIIIDSVKLTPSGSFSFKYKFNRNEPQFFNLRIGNTFVPLLVEPGERINLNAFCDIRRSLKVTGSKGTELITELNHSMGKTFYEIDSLSTILSKEVSESERQKLEEEIMDKYIKQKRNNIKFIVTNCSSLAAVYALYQNLPNGMAIFGDDTDFHYFKLVADSVSVHHPLSVHVRTLVKDVEQYENRNNIQNLITSSLSDNTPSPDLEMNDMFGKPHKLSSLRGKTVLLYFWSTQVPNATLMNRELLEIYNTYSSKGFEVYQVSLDRSKQDWLNMITTQKLPWINVNDFMGEKSEVVSVYNVTSVPSNYILDRDGNIVGKNLWDNSLIKKIEETL